MRTLPCRLDMLKYAMGVRGYAVYNAFAIPSVPPLLIVHLLLGRRAVGSIVSGVVR